MIYLLTFETDDARVYREITLFRYPKYEIEKHKLTLLFCVLYGGFRVIVAVVVINCHRLGF